MNKGYCQSSVEVIARMNWLRKDEGNFIRTQKVHFWKNKEFLCTIKIHLKDEGYHAQNYNILKLIESPSF